MIWIIAALAIPLLYVLFVRWQMTFPVCVAYHQTWSPLLRLLLPSSMRAISLWRTCWLLYVPSDPRGKIGPTGRKHEIKGHIENPDQWAGHPYAFPFMYGAESARCAARYGFKETYNKNKYEEQARAIAGEPSRIVP
jgi:hypothetical protein